METKCEHEWCPSGLWDGKTPEGVRTGGVLYVCAKCKDKAYTKQEVDEKGGAIREDLDAFGKDTK